MRLVHGLLEGKYDTFQITTVLPKKENWSFGRLDPMKYNLAFLSNSFFFPYLDQKYLSRLIEIAFTVKLFFKMIIYMCVYSILISLLSIVS